MGENVAGPTPGLNLERFSAWLKSQHPELGVPQRATVLTGGRSNLTLALDCGNKQLVLRRPPLGHVMETAHDMTREFTVQQALHQVGFPVPRMYFSHDDTEGSAGVGAGFYMMDKAPGRPFDSLEDNTAFTPRQLHDLSLEMVRTLAKLHGMVPSKLGLEHFGRPEGYLERQVRRWSKQLTASSSRDLPELEELARRLVPVPASSGAAIVHGDYKLNNALIRPSDGKLEITAILDWEMSTLGDPLADLALFGLYWQMRYLDPITAELFESSVDYTAGYPAFDELVDTYAAVRALPEKPDLSWHLAFAAFKTAVITESIHYRHLGGGTVGDGFSRMGEMTLPLARAGHRFLSGETTAAHTDRGADSAFRI